MKQTAVEWLAKELESYGDPQICKITWEDLDSLVNQAKTMFEKQMIDFAEDCLNESDCLFNVIQQYNETFKSE
jgi:hypothetical protein